MIDVEGYRNFRGELRVGMRFISGGGFDRVLTRDEAATLRDKLNEALETNESKEEKQ
jgi:hypothetical protein